MNGRWRRLAARVNPSCRDMMALVSRLLDRSPTRVERVILAVHLLHCPACRRARRQISLLVRKLRFHSGDQSRGPSGPLPALPPAARERIIEMLRRE